jgi:hypothetical protein
VDDISGIVYLLNQAGNALAQSNQRIAQLSEENAALRAALADTQPG